jgi:Flp pilus assembly protein TadG
MRIFRLIVMLRERCRRFGGAVEANTIVVFALAFLPLLGLLGAAIDYSRANAAKTAMQAAADTTVLVLAQNAASQSAPDVQAAGATIYQSLLVRPEATNLKVTATYSTTGGSTVVVSATAAYKTIFMSIMGFAQVPLAVSSTATFGNTRLRVALVLDNTGSMADASKMTALKTATTNLLNQLKAAAVTNADVYVSIIPFAKDVNLGATNSGAGWIDWTDWEAQNGAFVSSGHGKQTWVPADHSTWNGCIADRGNSSGPSPGNYDTNVVAPTTSITATLFSAEQYQYCLQASTGLSYNWTTMKQLVSNMSPAGGTNQAIGLALGWMALAGGGPFSVPAKDANYTYNQVIILLTDGLNTQDRWYGNGTLPAAQVDARQVLTCANIKAAGIILYTIQVTTDASATSNLLRNCASDASKFFALTSASQIVTTFSQIGTSLSKLRIAK